MKIRRSVAAPGTNSVRFRGDGSNACARPDLARLPGAVADGYMNALAGRCLENSVEKGFYPRGPSPDRDVPAKLMLMVSELSEALEAWRDGRPVAEIYVRDGKPEGVPVELADTLIRVLEFCAAYGVDVDRAVEVKMAFNASRPFRHGGKKA